MTNGILRDSFVKGLEMESPHSPTDSSEDSVEVKVEAIRSKRKLSDPRRCIISICATSTEGGPLKKRICVRSTHTDPTPFRPWSPDPTITPTTTITNNNCSYFRPPSPPPQPIDLKKRSSSAADDEIRVPVHPTHTLSVKERQNAVETSEAAFPKLKAPTSESGGCSISGPARKEQRNYKNMTRERRIEANARERTRVHTISAAFDTLRKSVPAYSHSQKLSKLSVLRIACGYIETLNNILHDSPDVPECIESVSRTIQREGKARKKKDDE